MNPLGVVVGHVVSEQAPEMTFAEDDHVIEKLSSTGSHPSLGDRVLPGAAVRRAHGIDAEGPDRSHDFRGEDRVAIEKEVARSALGREGFSKLLDHPMGAGIRGNVEVDQPSASVIDDEPDVQQLEAHRGDDAEVHCRDGVLVISEESHPALATARIGRVFREIAGDRRQADSEAKLRELALDLPRPPAILECKAADQLSHFLRYARLCGPASGKSSPVETEALAMPADHGLGLDNDQDFLPARPEPVEHDPEGAIKGCEPRSGSRLGVDRELLAKGQLDDRVLPASSEEGQNAGQQ